MNDRSASPSAADLSRIFGFDLPRHHGRAKPLPRFRGLLRPAPSYHMQRVRFGTHRNASVQQKNPALWRGFSGYRLVYLFECLLHRSLWVVTIRYALLPSVAGSTAGGAASMLAHRSAGVAYFLPFLRARFSRKRRAALLFPMAGDSQIAGFTLFAAIPFRIIPRAPTYGENCIFNHPFFM